MWWALGISVALVVLLGGLALYFGIAARRTERELGEVRRAREDLEAKLAEQAKLFDLLLEPDPAPGDLPGMSEAAARRADPAGRGLSPMESRAVDRLLRAVAARDRGAGEG